jgi:5-methylcytosine-specific restriction enzyme A
MPTTNTFLFAWNPVKWPWPEIGEEAARLKKGKKVTETWNCVSHKKIKRGDRAFFTRVGSEPRGIFASGKIVSEPFICKSRKGKDIFCVKIEFDALLDPGTAPILTLDILALGKLQKQLWTPQTSGITIRPELTEELEAVWADFLENGIFY